VISPPDLKEKGETMVAIVNTITRTLVAFIMNSLFIQTPISLGEGLPTPQRSRPEVSAWLAHFTPASLPPALDRVLREGEELDENLTCLPAT
jgi:hypothetical protein